MISDRTVYFKGISTSAELGNLNIIILTWPFLTLNMLSIVISESEHILNNKKKQLYFKGYLLHEKLQCINECLEHLKSPFITSLLHYVPPGLVITKPDHSAWHRTTDTKNVLYTDIDKKKIFSQFTGLV